MEPILKNVAREYTRRNKDLKGFCFIFPNKRCGIFLKKYFGEAGLRSDDLPHILTISEFMSQLSGLREADKMTQLFTLYNCYRELFLENPEEEKSKKVEFEAFRIWGETVLNDFNTVDLYLANPEEIFKNIKDYREITSNFLTDDQKEVIKEYFGEEPPEDTEEFWKNFSDPENLSELKKSFINLWQLLGQLHEKFISALEKHKLGTTGCIYCKAVNNLIKKGLNTIPYKKIVAVGFNALSEAERRLMKELQNLGDEKGHDTLIDFIWDASGPILSDNNFTASKFVNYNREIFPMPEWWEELLEEENNLNYPDITIISAPSATAQAKVAGEILKTFTDEKHQKLIKEAEVAMVLPDEALLTNLLYSLPDETGEINLTMGISLRQSAIHSFMNLVRRLFANTRTIKGKVSFYVKDLRTLTSHPYSYVLFDEEEINHLMEYIDKSRKVNISIEDVEARLPLMAKLFDFRVSQEDALSVFEKAYEILDTIREKLSEANGGEETRDTLEVGIYKKYMLQLEQSLKYFHIDMKPLSILQMAEKLVGTEKAGFEGEPLTGLQVMGTLETRSIDFDTIIILSMNEGVMPRKSNTATFIPDTLRKAYGLPPAHYAEEIFGYYFYRLLSRARDVYLIYDGRTISGMRGGESRYLLQLKEYAPSEKLKTVDWKYRLASHEDHLPEIEKTEEIRELTQLYSAGDGNRKNFSASSLNTYRECEVKFFLQNILNINSDPEPGEYMDPISIGNVLHEVMMDLYMPEEFQRKLLETPLIIEADFLKTLIEHPEIIHNLTIQKIQKIYYGDGDKDYTPNESGVIDMMADQLESLVTEIIKHDLTIAPFKLYGCEISRNIKVKLNSGRSVNFRFAIDRLDEILEDGEWRLRIVDYKTGSKKRKAEDLDQVFGDDYRGEQIFQLFTYAWLLGKIGMKGWEDVMTEIYFVPDMVKGQRGLPTIGGEEVKSFRQYYVDFEKQLENLIESIFQSPSFIGKPGMEHCIYCEFKRVCSK